MNRCMMQIPTSLKVSILKHSTHSRSSQQVCFYPPFQLYYVLLMDVVELRLMILRYMLPGPRVLELQKHTPRCRGVEAFFTHEPVPAVMHVCSEFRKEAQKYYKRHFPRYDSYNDGRLQAEAQITLNLNKDIIYVRCIFEVVNDEMSAEDLDRIQFLALDAGVSDSLYMFYMFHTLHNLKELILVIDMNPFGRGLDGASTRRDIVFEDVRPLTAGGDWISMEEYMQVEGKPLVYVNHMGEGLDHVWDNRMIGLENDVNGFVDRVARLKEEHPEWNMPLVKIALRKMTAASMEELAELHEELQQRSQSPVEYNEWKGQTKPPNLIYEDSYSEESSSDGSPSDED